MAVRRVHRTARGLLFRQGGLLVMQGLGESYTHLPGGHLDPGEQAIDALIREMREELGAELAYIEWLAKIENDWLTAPVHEAMDLYRVHTWPLWAPLRALESHLTARWVPWYAVEMVDMRPREVYPWIRRLATKVA